MVAFNQTAKAFHRLSARRGEKRGTDAHHQVGVRPADAAGLVRVDLVNSQLALCSVGRHDAVLGDVVRRAVEQRDAPVAERSEHVHVI